MVLDVVLFAVLLAFLLLGAWRGAVESLLRLLSLVGSYALAVYAARVSGPPLAEALGLPPLLALPLAGTAAFVASHVLFAVAIAGLRAARRRRGGEGPGPADRALGAAFGAARGALIVVLLGWLGMAVSALGPLFGGGAAPVPDATDSQIARWSGRVAQQGAFAALGREAPAARMAGALAANPGETVQAARSLLEHPAIVELQRDAAFWAQVEEGRVAYAVQRGSFRDVAVDAELRGRFAELGLVSAADAASPHAFRLALTPVLEEVGVRVAALRSDPEFQALLQDPEVLDLLQRGDTLGLLAHPRFQSLVQRVTARS